MPGIKNPEKRMLLNDATSSLESSANHGSYSMYSATEQPNGELGGYQEIDSPAHVSTNPLQTQVSRISNSRTLSWKHVVVKANIEKKEPGCLSCCKKNQEKTTKPILRDVTGIAKAGSFLVIMGASGSGKTTLLNCLTRRNLGELEVEGDIMVNGNTIGEDINGISGYIQQDDLFVGTLTIREHLWFNAVLRMDKEFTDEKRIHRIEEVIQEMGLKKSEDTVIGVPGMIKGISGGEKKRLAFASELLTRPSILFCDEPTSGLDSFMAQSVIQSLKNLADRGHTILCTVHQPSSDVFAMFDDILLMSEGRVAYMGPTKDMSRFFGDLGYNCPTNYNPADYFIQALAIVPGNEAECKQVVGRISDCYEESSYARSMQYQIEEQEIMGNDKFIVDMDKVGRKSDTENDMNKNMISRSGGEYQASWLKQLSMCLWRSVKDAKRNKRVMPARVLQVWVSGLFLGTLYWQQPYDMTGVSNINGALFMLMIQVSFNVAFTIAASFAKEFPIFIKENQDRQYRVSAYYLGKILIDLPVMAFAALMYCVIAYWMIGLYSDAATFFIFTAALLLMSQIAVAFGHLCSSIFPNPQLALSLLPFLMGITLLFTGFLVKDDSIVKVFKPIAWVSAYRYTYEILLVNQWRNVDYLEYNNGKQCDFTDEASDLRLTMNVTTDYTSDDHQQSSNWCYPNGMAVIYSYQYDPDSLASLFGINVSIFIATEFIGYLFLRRQAAKSK